MSVINEQSDYRIPPGTKLIIVDAHDTIFKPDLSRTEADIFNDPMKKERIGFVENLSTLHLDAKVWVPQFY